MTTHKKNRPLINCYYYNPHNHSLLDQHLEWDMAKIAELGCDIVSVCVHEWDLTLWPQQRLHNVVDSAHRHGLKIHAVPNWWGGILAGWLPGECGPKWEEDTTPGKQLVRAYFEKTLTVMLDAFEFDGVIWDEPRPPEDHAQVALFLDDMSAFIKSINPEMVISLFGASDWLDFAPHLVPMKHMDYLGVDGHVRANDYQMHRMKPTIFQAHEAFYPVLNAAGKKTMFLLEGQRHRDEDLENYLENLDKALALPMDHLMFYYSAHEMSPEKAQRMTDVTWEKITEISRLG
jgi:hypothetical protein